VTVDNLTDAQTVLFTGDQGNLFLHHTGLFGTDHLTIADGSTLNSLHTDMEFGLVVQIGTGSNVIAGVSDVNTDVTFTGGGNLQFGNGSTPYDFANGILDATASTGAVDVFLAGALGLTFNSGTGNDTVNFLGFNNTVANFSGGGADTAVFYQVNQPSGFLITNQGYNQVTNASANDHVDINIPLGNLTNSPLDTTQGGAVGATDATNTFLFTSGTNVNATGAAFNFVEITTGVNTGALTVQQAWNAAMGSGIITVSGSPHSNLAAFYDLTNQQAVFVAVDTAQNNANQIQGADHVDTVGMIHESQADFLSSGGNHLAFV
jgi:hypothetical protein